MVAVTVDRLDEAALRLAFSCFPSGVVAVCAMVDAEPVGMAASSFTPVSIDPPLVSLCIQNCSTTWPRLRDRRYLGVSILAEGHDQTCIRLSHKTGDRFAGVGWDQLSGGAVLLQGAASRLNCRLYNEIPAGDHLIALLSINSLEADATRSPLVFHHSVFRRLATAAVEFT